MKLGVIYEPTSNSYYRAVFPMRALESRGHTVVWPSDPFKLPLQEFLTCDLVHCYRRTDHVNDIQMLSGRGVAISFDNDDNYAAAEMGQGAGRIEGFRHNKRIFRDSLKMARLADLMTTPSGALADVYRTAGASNVTVIENRLQRGMFGFGSRSKHDGVVIGWVAGIEHKADMERIQIATALARLLDAHPDLRVLTTGVRLPIHSDRYEHVVEVDYLDLLKFTGRMDIGIAPLSDTPFNRCRSDVKLKEYASSGTPWLASPVGPYQGLGESEGGLLVSDDDWFDTLDALVRDRRRRKRLGKRALAWAKRETLDRHIQAWEAPLMETIDRVRDHGEAAGRPVVAQEPRR
jgi:glycosyltransferase involved in cell wall biosynthesis